MVVVSERTAARFWPGQDSIGKRIKFGQLTSNSPWLSIVGVVGEVKYRGLPENPTAIRTVSAVRRPQPQFALVVRGRVAPSSLVSPVRAAIRPRIHRYRYTWLRRWTT